MCLFVMRVFEFVNALGMLIEPRPSGLMHLLSIVIDYRTHLLTVAVVYWNVLPPHPRQQKQCKQTNTNSVYVDFLIFEYRCYAS